MTAPASRPPTKSPYAYTPPTGDGWKMVRWARIGLTLLLIPLSVIAFRHEYGHIPLLSDIIVAIHEFGHYLFMPFGETLTTFGEHGTFDVGPWADRVRSVAAEHEGAWELPVVGEVAAPAAVLIRPDGHVAWAGDPDDPALPRALTKWFGAGRAA